jgi:(1->4)-alpha-D-glucan 1-alpha-D-glucosylmutase
MARAALLKKLSKLEAKSLLIRIARELTASKEEGLIKLYLIRKALNYRKQNAEVFEKGDYVPLDSEGSEADNVCSFVRQLNDRIVLAAAPRFFTKLVSRHDELPFGKGVWKDSSVLLPFETEGARYRNILTDEIVNTRGLNGKTGMNLSEIFANFPVALMEKVAAE